MARTRNLKPGFFQNEDLAACGFPAMILYAGLWTIADRDGRLEDRPKRIKAAIFPYHPSVHCDALIQTLADTGFIRRYSVNGTKYIDIPSWNRHQNPHVKEQASIIPAPDMPGASPVQAPDMPGSCTGNSGTSPALTLNQPPLTLNQHSSTPEPGARPLCLDDQFSDFRSIAETFGINGSEPDWKEAHFEWGRMDFHQRLAAVQGIRDRSGSPDDPARKSLPKNYLRRRMWERKVQPSSTSKMDATMEAFDNAIRRDTAVQSEGHRSGTRQAINTPLLASGPRNKG